jgi:uncharacterized protein with von Willebrand factor type A (vWA) domain
MKLRDHARKLFNREKLSERSVISSRVDDAVFRDVRRRAAAVEAEVEQPPMLPNGEILDGRVWERLAEDLFSEFFGDGEPELRNRDKIDPSCHVNRQIADKHSRSEQFPDTRAMTRGEVAESAIALKGALQSYRRSYGNELGEHGEGQNDISRKQDQLDDLDGLMEKLREERQDAPDQNEIDRKLHDLGAAKRLAIDALEASVEKQRRRAGSLVDATTKAAQKAAGKAKEMAEMVSLAPGSQGGPGARIPIDRALALAERVHANPTLRNVLAMLGRLEISMGNTRRQMRKGGYEELVDIETGNDLQAVLHAEKALLTHPVARLDFYRRFHERSLMQYEYQSEEELKKGPIIVGADGSGSMIGAPNEFCRALTLACIGIANREKRNAAAIEFGSTGQMREFVFPAGRPLDQELAIEFGEHFFCGGTDINQVLVRAKEMIDSETPFHSADLIIITDGGDRLTDRTIQIRDALRTMGVKIHGLMVAGRPTQYLIEVCDNVTPVWEFAGPNNASDRLAIDLT